jgi:transposase
MRKQERIEQLERELAGVREQLAQRDAIIGQLQEQIADLQGRLGKDSHNSHKPPSSDGFQRRTPVPRKGEAKRRGSPIGHRGETLHLSEHPDQIERHRPSSCDHCGALLEAEAGHLVERRQVVELPEIRVAVIEHRRERVWCPRCQQPTTGTFPDEVSSRIQYGPRLQALAVYLRMQHLLPVERTSEVLYALTGETIAGASILAWEQAAAHTIAPAIDEVREELRHVEVLHGDETSLRIGTVLHWVHVHSTRLLTLLQWHRKRGRSAMDAVDVLPHVAGTVVHDRWESYWHGMPSAMRTCSAICKACGKRPSNPGPKRCTTGFWTCSPPPASGAKAEASRPMNHWNGKRPSGSGSDRERP